MIKDGLCKGVVVMVLCVVGKYFNVVATEPKVLLVGGHAVCPTLSILGSFPQGSMVDASVRVGFYTTVGLKGVDEVVDDRLG